MTTRPAFVRLRTSCFDGLRTGRRWGHMKKELHEDYRRNLPMSHAECRLQFPHMDRPHRLSAFCCALLLSACTRAAEEPLASTPEAEPPPSIVQTAGEVDAKGWVEYRNDSWGIALLHPAWYQVQEEKGGVVTISHSGGDVITLSRIQRTTLQREVGKDFLPNVAEIRWGNPGIAFSDMNVVAARMWLFTGSISHEMLYLITRIDNLPQPWWAEPKKTSYDIIQAHLSAALDPSGWSAAGITDTSTVLSKPEQILSTFRFTEAK